MTSTSPRRAMLAALLAATAALAGLAAPPAHAEPDARKMLEACDAVRNPPRPFRLDTVLVEYRDGKQVGTSSLQVFSKLVAETGQYANLVRFTAPARDLDKLMLKAGRDLWLHDPANKASVRISPQQRLLGQVSNGDVVTTNLSREYTPRYLGEEDIVDGDRKPCHCHKLELVEAVPEATYHRIELWLNADDGPVKAYFYAEGGKLLKTAFYRRYEDRLGASRPTEMVIIDGVVPTWVTVMRFSNHAWHDVPDSWLRPEYFAKVKVD